VRWCYADHDVYGYGAGYTDEDGDGSFSLLPGNGDFTFVNFGMDKKSKDLNIPFLKFIENHPHLFPLLRQLLGL